MPIKPIGWICGQVIKRLSGQGIAVVEIIDEIKDEFPTIIGMQQSNQAEAGQKPAITVVGMNIEVINGLNRISTSSKSVAKALQPKIVQNFAELNTLSHRLLKNVNIPKQPLYKNQSRTFSLFDVISYPAKTALTSIMCASYAALIYVVSISVLTSHPIILAHSVLVTTSRLPIQIFPQLLAQSVPAPNNQPDSCVSSPHSRSQILASSFDLSSPSFSPRLPVPSQVLHPISVLYVQ
uniref:Uncharacterized protein n=1 Tax=Gopherus agassizii TaxID=38772 RepID=A0A452HAK1_9SAUR